MPTSSTKCGEDTYTPSSSRKREYAGDYAFAISCAAHFGGGRHLERGYNVATHLAQVIAKRRRAEHKPALADAFRTEVIRWKDETGHLSSITKAMTHPSYLRIIGLAKESTDNEIERLLLNELESEPDHWFAALIAITGENPVSPTADFDEAVSEWLEWGHQRGII